MKKIFVLSIFIISCFGATWSSVALSGISIAYTGLENLVNSKNNEIKNFWDTNIGNLIKEIEKESKERERNLKQLEALDKELLLNKKELNFLLEQNNNLLNIKASVNGV